MSRIIRNANISDFDEIISIYKNARTFMAKTGNPNQWKNVHPSADIVKSDIENMRNYVVEDDGEIVGVFFFNLGVDKTYNYIENGRWLNDESYGVIHRIASKEQAKGIVKSASNFAFERTNNVRIDTHKDNKVMQHVLEKNGFIRCGIIYIESGEPRIAYQKTK